VVGGIKLENINENDNMSPGNQQITEEITDAEKLAASETENGYFNKHKDIENQINEFAVSGIIKTEKLECFTSQVKGFSHIRDDKNCQDAFACEKYKVNDKEVIIAVVADGHGGDKHYLSEFGSRIAVDCTVELLKSVLDKYISEINVLYNTIKLNFPALILRLWKNKVVQDYSQRFPKADEEDIRKIVQKYGTTLLFCVAVDTVFIYGKLGDGNIVIYKNNNYIEPIEDDDDLIGSATYSLCHLGAALGKWNIQIMYDCDLVTLSTDGLLNAFEEGEFHNSIDKINSFIEQYGSEASLKSLPSFLSRCSNAGSGDDITLCCIKKLNK
jgi:serine/threonine protein phosphatase PrpC